MVIMAASTPSVRAGISSAMAVAHAQKSHSAPPSLPVLLELVSAATTTLQSATVVWSASCRHLSPAHAPNSASLVSLDEQPKAPLSMTAKSAAVIARDPQPALVVGAPLPPSPLPPSPLPASHATPTAGAQSS